MHEFMVIVFLNCPHSKICAGTRSGRPFCFAKVSKKSMNLIFYTSA